jgi:hypothetical protein
VRPRWHRRLPRRAASHRRLLHLPRRVEQILTLLFTRQPLETPRRLFDLIGERALLGAAAATAAAALTGLLPALERLAPLPLGFLLLPARQLLQLLEQLVHLAVVLLLRRLVGRLVAARDLVEILLEELRQLLLHRRRRHRRPRRRPGGRPRPAARTPLPPSAAPAAPCSRSAAPRRC